MEPVLRQSRREQRRERRLALEAIIRELNEEVARGSIVIVEGKRDEVVLRAAGYRGPLIKVKSLGGRARNIGERLASRYRRAVILVDFDREGSKLARHLGMELSFYGIDVDYGFRESFFEAFGGEIREVEALRRLAEEGLELA